MVGNTVTGIFPQNETYAIEILACTIGSSIILGGDSSVEDGAQLQGGLFLA
jgi:hypothetical protein